MYKVDRDIQREAPIIPPVRPPKGLKFFLGTWSGRLIVINSIFFILLSMDAGSFLDPSLEALIRWGAKDNLRIALGEYWRLITPIVLHGGVIHFAFNNWALYALGYQIEHILGKKWFLILYLVSGLSGNIASTIFSLNPSVGASSSLFGLLGVGFYLERVVGKRSKELFGGKSGASIYASMLMINLVIGFMIPRIDNAAHIGGLVSGVIVAFAWLRLSPNRVTSRNPTVAKTALGILGAILVLGIFISGSKSFLNFRLSYGLDTAQDPQIQYNYLSQMLAIDGDNDQARLLRLELSLKYGNYTTARDDFFELIKKSQNDAKIRRLEQKLLSTGDHNAVLILRKLQEKRGPHL